MTKSTDVAVVGAGPIGLELAVALKKRGVDYIHFDANQIGYTISWFAPQTQFFSSNERIAIAGVPLLTPNQAKATREQYLTYLRGVVQQFDLKVNNYEPIIDIKRDGEGFVLTSQPRGRSPQLYRSRRLVLCTGGTNRPRRLNIPGEDLPHVSHYFGDPHTYFRTSVLIVGGKNSAVEAALRCYHAGARVALSYRRQTLPEKSIKYWLLPEINAYLRSERIKGYMNTRPVAITPTHVVLDRDGERVDVPADFVLLLVGYEQDNTLFKLAGVELRGSCAAPVYDERTMETNVPGLYVAGTAVGGTQEKFTVFIENCHVHVDRIVAALTGGAPPPQRIAEPVIEQPES
ncbi:NAD(P)-binding domain-containing protein [Fontivita pretiosa]|uniref:NAD(P)-binding domain-containing protein n=1 Tax=Fontivita pretiosa TaxID=2989684 RepID=UPI003D17CCE7